MNQLRTAPPPPEARELHLWILNTGDELRELRASLNKALLDHGSVPHAGLSDVAERLVLVATELATNAIRHGRPPTKVRLLCTPQEFVLDVADHDLGSVPELADTRPAGAGGRGLQLALSLSLQVGWYATAGTKHIWATFPVKA